MKLYKLVSVTLLIAIYSCASAQKVTDNELKRYTIALDSIETLKNNLTATMNRIAKGNEKISSQRYTLLVPHAQNASKLAEAKATPGEIEYVRRAAVIQRDETAKFQKAYQALISDYVGDAVFSKVRHALTIDTTLQKKRDLLLQERKN